MLGEKIVEHMKQFGQRPAIQINDTGDVYTFAQILQRVEYYRQQLILRQLPAGCVAAVSLENVVEYIAVLLALWQHDCIVVPMGRVQCTWHFPRCRRSWGWIISCAGRCGRAERSFLKVYI